MRRHVALSLLVDGRAAPPRQWLGGAAAAWKAWTNWRSPPPAAAAAAAAMAAAWAAAAEGISLRGRLWRRLEGKGMHRVLHASSRLDLQSSGLELPPSRREMHSRADCSRWLMVDLLPPVCLAG
jgi:hypothetical protein